MRVIDPTLELIQLDSLSAVLWSIQELRRPLFIGLEMAF